MGKPIRKKISFAIVDMEEIEKIKEENNSLHNNSDVIQFLLYYYLENQTRDSDKDEILSKLSKMDYEMMLTQFILKESVPELLGVTDKSELFIKAEQKLKKQLRGLN